MIMRTWCGKDLTKDNEEPSQAELASPSFDAVGRGIRWARNCSSLPAEKQLLIHPAGMTGLFSSAASC